jgi:endonuclease YncB( thermonuclease family)
MTGMRRPAILLAVLLVIAATAFAILRSSPADAGPAAFRATIAYAVDGDTLRVREPGGELAYVRLVGTDTPEDVKPGYPSECGSKAAARSMEALAPEGAAVTLRYDSVADHEDTYGRTLAHGFIDGR